jgi:3-phosphoglycerate kinase
MKKLQDTFVPLFPGQVFQGQTKEQVEYAKNAERLYLEDTRFQDGPTENEEKKPANVIKEY